MSNIVLDPNQEKAIRSAFENNLTIITGPAGSGKSMICRYIVDIARAMGQSFRLMTPTGKAAQVLKEKTGTGVSTIHRSLELRKGVDTTTKMIHEDIVLIDEVSMCGIDTFYPIMKALEGNSRTRIVLVGDKNQLPSVSPGNFLSDIIESGCANVVMLEKIYRQDDKSYISLIAKEVSNGRCADIPSDASDIEWININESTFDRDLLGQVDYFIESGYKIDDIQIIAPMKKGYYGIYRLNKLMQDKMSVDNGTSLQYQIYKFNKFHVKDRVMQLENNYEKNVFNGDIGEVIEAGEKIVDATASDKKESYLTVRYYDDYDVDYVGSAIDELQLAWAGTIHKYQGSQSPCIIMILSNESQVMAYREILYTGMTRASKMLCIFGHMNVFRLAPTRSSIKKRYTNMLKIIKDKRTGNKSLLVRNSGRIVQ